MTKNSNKIIKGLPINIYYKLDYEKNKEKYQKAQFLWRQKNPDYMSNYYREYKNRYKLNKKNEIITIDLSI